MKKNRIGLVVIIVFSILGALSLVACEGAYVSPYNWKNLSYEGGRYYYFKDGELASRLGVDVSDHQGTIDWECVADDGIDFAFIRLGNRGYTEGHIYLDHQYYYNREKAAQAGLNVGVYFFSQARTEEEAREEAEFVLEHLGENELTYPVVYDLETMEDNGARANDLSKKQVSKNAEAFSSIIEQAGYDVMIYGNKGDIDRYEKNIVTAHDIWFAEYDVSIPSGQFDFVMWQYTDSGIVDGISGAVDMNILFLEP